MKGLSLYFLNILVGTFTTLFVLILICNHFHFDSKSAICVYLFGAMGYFVKSLFCFAPYFWLKNEDYFHTPSIKRLIVWSPFLLFFMWFTMVITFQIEAFHTDIEFGYISRFPHFMVQLLVVLMACIANAVFVYRKYKKVENMN
jgi:hypothetical protein